ncbi:MAG: hypothetical protein OXN84_14650, partial [Albidovulum sp.]|nr:hypothetical protein [Albidovulum sp.]
MEGGSQVSLSNDRSLLVAYDRVPFEFQDLSSKQLKQIHLPDDEQLWPRQDYMDWHRERFLGG